MTLEDLKYDDLLNIPFGGVGTQDCLSLVRGFYSENFGIEIPDFVRPNDWNADELDLIEILHERAGFNKITTWKPKDFRPGDLLCMAIGEQNANHLAVYVGEGEMIHHLFGRLSKKEPMRDFWFNSTCYLLRHPDVPNLNPVYPDVDIMDLVRARNTTPAE